LNIYTDGSSYPKPRKGGVGMLFVFLSDNGVDEIEIEKDLLGYRGATNNQMELQAVVLALKEVPSISYSLRVQRIVILTDSRYVVDNFSRAVYDWSRTKWHKRDGAPVANAVQWKELLKTVKEVDMRVDFKWVKGHAKNSYNKKVDKSAKSSAKGLLQKPLVYTDVRRKKTTSRTNVGSVVMEGQKMMIRIVTCEYQRLQKVFKLRYEVMSPRSEYYGSMDFIFCNDALRTGHTYYVKVNKEFKNPRILKVIREIVKK
jgi:ribonuclease HI